MQQYILSSFVSNKGGGNKAAVVFDDFGMSYWQMLELAKKNNFSETAFIDFNKSDGNRFNIRYFTPAEEVDICGHAALASFQVLKQLGYLRDNYAYHRTKAGELKVLIEGDSILIQMNKPELIMQLSSNIIMDITDAEKDEITTNRNGMIDVISTGLKDIILEVNGIEALKKLRIKKDKMIEICREYDIIGMHVVSRETIEEDSDFCCRNFAPAVGIDEESATGTSNASLLYYIKRNDKQFDCGKTYKVEQGYFMNSPSNIFVKYDQGTESIFVGGIARIDSMESVVI
ncbi:MAG: PhzF family phenazine biosynthesis protein [Clostridiaceae bacterium]|mgnify:FL=1|nr:PhzF family phenazine biosynthesis protein [Clostridiaceae bacterium]HPL98999.1 PhzF family phenazine biosynthesis protein [Bacillota bacterium]HPW40246.1 PhzF family phenazine biosynthesis protein [Bacillota bacterium]